MRAFPFFTTVYQMLCAGRTGHRLVVHTWNIVKCLCKRSIQLIPVAFELPEYVAL